MTKFERNLIYNWLSIIEMMKIQEDDLTYIICGVDAFIGISGVAFWCEHDSWVRVKMILG